MDREHENTAAQAETRGPHTSALRCATTARPKAHARARVQHAAQIPSKQVPGLCEQWLEYWADALWRSTATVDALGRRAANAQAHEAAGMPPLLHFEWEPIADGRACNPPSNYRLLRVTRCGSDGLERFVRGDAAPVVIVDPRAGHGPGIGGFRRDSEVGMALREGHPVYFVVFDPQPLEGQTIGAVVETIASFVQLVCRRHGGKEPILYGNCQGGWALVMSLSHCQRHAGMVVLNGSPLSYWAGAAGVNPMRLLGGFGGGVWPVHWLADLGAGRFDGAWLVQNFESLRPESVWHKHDAVFANPEAETERFLEFERWWNAFYFLGREEILAIVGDLFVGNKLEKGQVVVNGYCRANLKAVTTPLVIFASAGDNITPPHQALGWLRSVYSSTADIVAAGQRIVYLLDQHVGHLGIFVSGEIARNQHRAILHHARAIQALSPGLYEMVLGRHLRGVPRARFEPRALEQLPFDPEPPGFEMVQFVSEWLDKAYSSFVSPLAQAAASDEDARRLARWHPMRLRVAAWSPQSNAAVSAAQSNLERAREGALAENERASNHWYRLERAAAAAVYETIAGWRAWRDISAEMLFNQWFAALPWFDAASDRGTPSSCDGRCEQCGMTSVCRLAGGHGSPQPTGAAKPPADSDAKIRGKPRYTAAEDARAHRQESRNQSRCHGLAPDVVTQRLRTNDVT